MQWTPGLRRVVAFDGRPAPLADNVIKLMRRKLDGASGEFAHDFQPGDTVNITDGPLEGIMAIFEGPSTPTERVRVLLSFLGRTSRAYVPVFDLEKVAPRGDSSALKRPRRTRGRGRRIRHSQHPDYAAHRPNG